MMGFSTEGLRISTELLVAQKEGGQEKAMCHLGCGEKTRGDEEALALWGGGPSEVNTN